MAIGRVEQILGKASLIAAVSGAVSTMSQAGQLNGLTFLSRQITISTEPGWVLLCRMETAPTGTTPGIVWEVDLSDNGGAFTRVGAAIAAQTAVGALVVPYYTSSTQGLIIPSFNATHTYVVQVKGVLANADNVFPSVSVDLIAI